MNTTNKTQLKLHIHIIQMPSLIISLMQQYHIQYNINFMQQNIRTNLIEVIKQYETEDKRKRIVKKASNMFLMRSFKIQSMTVQQTQNCYDRLHEKYQSKEISYIVNDWNKNQRRLFLWYLICYCQSKKCTFQELSLNQWEKMAEIFFGKNPLFLKFQALTILKNIKRYMWTEEDDKLLQHFVNKKGANAWNQISKCIFFHKQQGKFISPKQCRQRWFNHVCSQINKTSWTNQQDLQILNLALNVGKKWSLIARQLNTKRTQHMIKNRFNSVLNKYKTRKIQNQQNLIKRIIKKIQQSIEIQKQSNQKKNEQTKLSSNIIRKINIQIPKPQRGEIKNLFQLRKNIFIKTQESHQNTNLRQIQGQKNLKQIIDKYDMGIVTFSNSRNNNGQEVVQSTPNEVIEGAAFSMTPSTVKPISPFNNGFFRSFHHCANSFERRRLDGSSLFSPAVSSTPTISPIGSTTNINVSNISSPPIPCLIRSTSFEDIDITLKKNNSKKLMN